MEKFEKYFKKKLVQLSIYKLLFAVKFLLFFFLFLHVEYAESQSFKYGWFIGSTPE